METPGQANWGTASCDFRLSQESIRLMLPLITERRVRVPLADMKRILSDAKVVDGRTSVRAAAALN
jgi:hypothetical protein